MAAIEVVLIHLLVLWQVGVKLRGGQARQDSDRAAQPQHSSVARAPRPTARSTLTQRLTPHSLWM